MGNKVIIEDRINKRLKIIDNEIYSLNFELKFVYKIGIFGGLRYGGFYDMINNEIDIINIKISVLD